MFFKKLLLKLLWKITKFFIKRKIKKFFRKLFTGR